MNEIRDALFMHTVRGGINNVFTRTEHNLPHTPSYLLAYSMTAITAVVLVETRGKND